MDSKGRPRSKVRFGRWSFATSLLDQTAYEQVLALMLSDTAVVDARAEYLRADGQGVFVTVWGRRCTVSHVYEHFDSRGTNGRQPGCILYFSLTAEEMGRQAGTAGPFLMPEPTSYAAPVAATSPVAVTPPTAPVVNPDDIPPHLPAPIPNPSPRPRHSATVRECIF